MKVVLYTTRAGGRAGHVAKAMQMGLLRHGIRADVELRWDGRVKGDVAIAYGWVNEPAFTAYRDAGGHYAYFDMGYFNRKPTGDKGGSREGHHRLAVDSWDTAATMRRGCPSDRWDGFGIELLPWRTREPAPRVLVAGMSAKAAGTHGFAAGEWERVTTQLIRRTFPNLPITVREKPPHLDQVEPIADVIARHTIVVSHHSNVSVDALVAGVPSWATKGVGKLVAYDTVVDAIKRHGPALTVAERVQVLSDVAYAQWTPAEMRSGEVWSHIKGIINAL